MTSPRPHAVLLCAGLGSRLLPLTADRPKCLIEIGGRTILEHQVEALVAAGVAGVTVVGGYRFERLAAFVETRWPDRATRPDLVFNPFYAVSSSIGSIWAVRERLQAPFCLLNGDTVYDPVVVADGLSRAPAGISLLVEPIVDPEPDEMRVRIDGTRIVAVAKDLPPGLARHRSLGIVIGRNDGGAYARALERVIGGIEGVQAFHHAVLDRLAHEGPVVAISVDRGRWVEIDRPEDIARWSGTAPSPSRDSATAAL